LNNRLKILICPLEWGLGHAGRMIPLAKRLMDLGHIVIIGSGEEHLSMFREELKDLLYIKFPGFKPRYSRFLPPYLSLLFKIPSLLFWSFSEHKKLKGIIREHDINLVISDNRFGLWIKSIMCIYITHMPRIPFPRAFRSLELTGILLHRWIIRKYSYCLIPDLPGNMNLTGRLAHGLKLPSNVRYIGLLSRFSDAVNNAIKTEYPSPRTTLILSGPEPLRSILREKVISLSGISDHFTVILEGRPERGKVTSTEGKILSFSHLRSLEMKRLISGSDRIISRSGYTTIMELISMNCSALLIPTPGQTEQEYLAEYTSARGWFKTVKQKDLTQDMDLTLPVPPDCQQMLAESKLLLESALEEILEDQEKQDHAR
jgi:predicted glycosyltransferase